MLSSIIPLCVFGLLLFAADGLARRRLGRPQRGRIGRAGLALPRVVVDGGSPAQAVMGGNQEPMPRRETFNAVPQTAQ